MGTTGRKQFAGERISVRFDRVGPSTLVTIAERTPSDTLSPRERVIAERFAGGESYKEVARHLGASPATVRHHLRVVYRKLGVGDKGALSSIIANHRLLQEPRT
jgi:DNA-binding CsgD family transcriptional regulator